jgi:20S proteasome alpha/beta subunit
MSRSRLLSVVNFLAVLLGCMLIIVGCAGNESLEGRFSFSLSTFDPSGKIGQVERALIASSLGTPIVAVVKHDRILLASPQILPSPLMEDDGTARFAAVTPQIAVGHSGISADGRVLIAAAQQLAVEHAYTYDENIPIDLFLEEMSLLYQEYTMTPGVRPFGAILLVAYVPSKLDDTVKGGEDDEDVDASNNPSKPLLFRLDPSGSVITYEDTTVAIVNGRFEKSRSVLDSSLEELSTNPNNTDTTESQDRQRLSRILEEAISPKEPSSSKATTSSQKASPPTDATKSAKNDETLSLPSSIITASLTRESGLQVERRKLSTAASTDSSS